MRHRRYIDLKRGIPTDKNPIVDTSRNLEFRTPALAKNIGWRRYIRDIMTTGKTNPLKIREVLPPGGGEVFSVYLCSVVRLGREG